MGVVTGGGGGGSMPSPNWCLLSLDTPAPLTRATDLHAFAASELHILEQSSADFTVATVTGNAAVASARGGMFQVGAAIGCPAGPTLDPGSTATRYLWFSAEIGGVASPSSGLAQLGYDSLTPIFPTGTDNGDGSALQSVASLPGVVAPGGPALYNPVVELVGAVGTDSIPLDAVFIPTFGTLAIWQIAA